MKRMPSSMLVALVALASFLPSHGSAAVITNAVKVSGNATAINLLPGGLAEGVLAYTDRTHVLVNIPDALEGADLVQVSNSDKTSSPYQVDVTSNLGLIYVGLDDRLSTQPLPWMNDNAFTGLPDGFFDTGAQIDIDEGNNGSVDQTFSLWVTLAGAGTYQLGEQNDGGSRNNYIILGSTVVVPEPSTMTLLAIGLIGFVGSRRRRSS